MARFADLKLAFLQDAMSIGSWNKFFKDRNLKAWMVNSSDNMCDLGTKLDYLRHVISENKYRTSGEMKLLAAHTSLPTDDAVRNLVRDLPPKGPINRSALMWILYSARPLTPTELTVCCILEDGGTGSAINLGSLFHYTSESAESRFAKSQLSRICRIQDGRIHLQQNRGLPDLLVKETCQLLSLDSGPKTELHIFTRCIDYLKAIFDRFTGLTDLNPDSPMIVWSLLEYATMYWPIHSRTSGTFDKTIEFLSTKHYFDTWLELYSIYGARRHPPGEIPRTPVQVADYFRLDDVWNHFRYRRQFGGCSETEHRDNTVILRYTMVAETKDVSIQWYHTTSEYHRAGRWYANIVKECPSVLHLSARIGNQQVVQKLIEEAVRTEGMFDSSKKDSRGNNAMMYAAEYGFSEIVDVLSNPNLQPYKYRTPAPGHPASFRIKTDDVVTAANKSGNTALHLAASNGHAKIVTLLIQRGSNLQAKNNLGYTPLHIACKEGSLNLAKICVEASRNRDLPAGQNDAASGNRGLIRLPGLGDLKTALKTRDTLGNNPLHLAAQFGHDNVVTYLVDPMDDGQTLIPIDLPNGLGLTALHLAAENNHAEVCQILLDLGASIIALSVAGDTPVSLAKMNQNAEVVAIFKEYLKSPAGRSKAEFFTDA